MLLVACRNEASDLQVIKIPLNGPPGQHCG